MKMFLNAIDSRQEWCLSHDRLSSVLKRPERPGNYLFGACSNMFYRVNRTDSNRFAQNITSEEAACPFRF